MLLLQVSPLHGVSSCLLVCVPHKQLHQDIAEASQVRVPPERVFAHGSLVSIGCSTYALGGDCGHVVSLMCMC